MRGLLAHVYRWCRPVAKIGRTLRPRAPRWRRPCYRPVVVTIRNRNGVLDVVGIDRPTEFPEAVPRQAGK